MHKRASSWYGRRCARGVRLHAAPAGAAILTSGGRPSIQDSLVFREENQLPSRRLMRLVCLPINPMPARCARSRSRMGRCRHIQGSACPVHLISAMTAGKGALIFQPLPRGSRAYPRRNARRDPFGRDPRVIIQSDHHNRPCACQYPED